MTLNTKSNVLVTHSMKLLLILFLLVSVSIAAPPFPDVPNSWTGMVTIEIPFIGKQIGRYYFDYPNMRTRAEFKHFGVQGIQIDDYVAKTSYMIQKQFGTSCDTEELTNEIYPTALPPLAYYTGQETIRGIECEVWEFKMGFEMGFKWWITRVVHDERPFAQVLRTVLETDMMDMTMDIDDMTPMVFERESHLFKVDDYHCPPPIPPVTHTVSGYVIDATTAEPIKGASVSITGPTEKSAEVNNNGVYVLKKLAPGDYTITASHGDYFQATRSLAVDHDIPKGTVADITLSKKLKVNEFRFVLNWRAQPRDLDLHIVNPDNCHVYFSNRQCGGKHAANLDIDRQQGYGPETIKISGDGNSGTFKLYVHNYSGEKSMVACGAEVAIYDSRGLVDIVKVPTEGEGRFWTVGKLVDGDFVVVNQIGNSP
ncbi:hypothetical protein GEMRC1_003418 [Eukaryota sp. GEM-RC1]